MKTLPCDDDLERRWAIFDPFEDGVLAESVVWSDGAFAGGFQEYVSMCYPRTASVQPEPRSHWNNLYHSSEIGREVAR
jgi:hypothetical protein